MLNRADRYLSRAASKLLASINRESLKTHFDAIVADSAETAVVSDNHKGSKAPSMEGSESPLYKYCSNITTQAKNGELDPVLCREEELNLMVDILCRRRKNNPIVVGDAGVGKSAMVEGLALRIAAGNVPERLQDVELFCLDLGLLQAGASVKGEFEKRLKGVIDGIKSAPNPIILFIDEAHTLIGSGNQEGGSDAANLLKPALARGELSTIAATTWKEYKKYFEKDPALTRRFQLVKLEEPSVNQAVDIMRGLGSVYEKAHGVLIADDALKAAAELSARYLSGRQLPDKAIDVLDTACARIAINLTTPPKRLALLETLCHQRQQEIEMLKRAQYIGQTVNQARLDELEIQEQADEAEKQSLQARWNEQRALVEEIIELRAALLYSPSDDEQADVLNDAQPVVTTEDARAEQAKTLAEKYDALNAIPHDQRLMHPHVDAEQVAEVISDWTGVPIDQMNSDELYKITNLTTLLGNAIKGQDIAIERIHRHLLTARADLRRSGRPKGAFFIGGAKRCR